MPAVHALLLAAPCTRTLESAVPAPLLAPMPPSPHLRPRSPGGGSLPDGCITTPVVHRPLLAIEELQLYRCSLWELTPLAPCPIPVTSVLAPQAADPWQTSSWRSAAPPASEPSWGPGPSTQPLSPLRAPFWPPSPGAPPCPSLRRALDHPPQPIPRYSGLRAQATAPRCPLRRRHSRSCPCCYACCC